MSSDNASSAVTYTFVSSDSNGPASWSIPLVNAGELPEMDPYEEVSQQGKAHPLSPAYVPDPIELDEHPDSNSMEEDIDADSIDYLDEPKDGEEDDDDTEDNDDDDDDTEDPSEEHEPRKDPSEEHEPEKDPNELEDPEKDPSEEHEPEDNDDDDDTEDEDEEHLALVDSSVVPVIDPVPLAGDIEQILDYRHGLKPPMSASMEACIAEHAAAPIPPTNPTYDLHHVGLAWYEEEESSSTAANTRVNLRVNYQAQVRKKESEDFYNPLLTQRHYLARLRYIELHISHMEWQRQRAEDDAVKQMP
ncbi:hypothetical protein Tco_0802517 [Tanacetum coccineum]|uniref:Uncharacterized protein n=1 Tax=Tanacetum coccineum TaxID=301880 RepID=A0ABQ4ZZ12_9ASTR